MKFLGNIIWFVFGGAILGLLWCLIGLLWCITIIGIPVGTQCFKIAKLAVMPFGKEIVRDEGNAGRFILNILWLIFGGIELAIGYALVGILFCITVIGIPFGKQNFKLAALALRPFGAKVVKSKNLK
ncbi:MAG: YccF domain-containing protein [Lachnospiraceae bacterium]|nr:YccF domain-containing protein [Lachnospiraceae bacterium]